jgi:hypothetical protein
LQRRYFADATRTFSGSNFSESAVNPETSANTIVTSLRSSVSARSTLALFELLQLFTQGYDCRINHSVAQTFPLRFKTSDRR